MGDQEVCALHETVCDDVKTLKGNVVELFGKVNHQEVECGVMKNDISNIKSIIADYKKINYLLIATMVTLIATSVWSAIVK